MAIKWFNAAASLIVMLAIVIFLSGCATNVASPKIPDWDHKPIGIDNREYTILGTVKFEKNWFGILGISIVIPPFFSIEEYIYQSGGVTYADLLDEARNQYPESDAVVDITVDYQGSFYGIFYAQRKNIVTGIAIKYEREPRPPNPAMDIRLR